MPSALYASAPTSSQINLAWYSSIDNVGVVRYNVYRNGTQIGNVTGTTYSDTGLAAQASYSYTVAAVDAAGNVSPQSNSASVTTPAARAASVLSAPTRLAAVPISSSMIRLTWTPPTPVLPLGATSYVYPSTYVLYRNGAYYSNIGSSFLDMGISPSTTVTYSVASIDTTGNITSLSASVSATTLAGGIANATAAANANCVSGTAPAVPAPLRTLYVDSDLGNDANDGLTAGTAWKTLSRANNAAIAGDQVLLKGTFIGQSLYPANAGTSSNRIVFKNMPGQSAIIYGSALYGGLSAIVLSKPYLVIDGLEVASGYFGVLMVSNNDWVRNVHVHNTAIGFSLRGASNNRIEDSRVHHCGVSPTVNTGGSFSCFSINNGSSNNVVTRNQVQSATGYLVWIFDNGSGSLSNEVSYNDLSNPWGTALITGLYGKNTLIQCNLIHDAGLANPGTYEPALKLQSDGNTVRYNTVYNNRAESIGIWVYNGISANDNDVSYNTISGNGGPDFRILLQDQPYVDNVHGNQIHNNVFWGNNLSTDMHWFYSGLNFKIVVDLYHTLGGTWPSGTLNGNVFQNNLIGMSNAETGGKWMMFVPPGGAPQDYFYTLSEATTAFPTGLVGNIEADPLFVDPAALDFHLQSGSPAAQAIRMGAY